MSCGKDTCRTVRFIVVRDEDITGDLLGRERTSWIGSAAGIRGQSRPNRLFLLTIKNSVCYYEPGSRVTSRLSLLAEIAREWSVADSSRVSTADHLDDAVSF